MRGLHWGVFQNLINGDNNSEYVQNTVFGNKIPKDFCKHNPPKYWNFTVTPKNSANFEKTLNDGSDFFAGWESREQSFEADPAAARKKIQDCIAKWDPAKMTNKLQFEDASENEYTLVGKMNRLQWMNWCVRPEVRLVWGLISLFVTIRMTPYGPRAKF